MKKASAAVFAAMCAVLSLGVTGVSGCGDPQSGGGAGGGAGTGGGSGGSGGGTSGPTLDTADHIFTYLEGKKLTMQGANIPNSPNGLNENFNWGQATQCFHSTVITVSSQTFNVTSQLGTVKSLDGGAPPGVGAMGVCDHDAVMNTPFMAMSTAIMLQNVKGNGDCFDIDVTYNGYSQEGRAAIKDNQMSLELFFKNKALNDRCADGNPGTATVKLTLTNPDGGAPTQYPFTGNAVQKYDIAMQ